MELPQLITLAMVLCGISVVFLLLELFWKKYAFRFLTIGSVFAIGVGLFQLIAVVAFGDALLYTLPTPILLSVGMSIFLFSVVKRERNASFTLWWTIILFVCMLLATLLYLRQVNPHLGEVGKIDIMNFVLIVETDLYLGARTLASLPCLQTKQNLLQNSEETV